jgi:CSLREA domain-containing protein
MPRSARTPILALLAAFVLLLAAAPAAMALELTVPFTADTKDGDCPSTHECSLREALELVEEGEEAEPAISGDVTIKITAEGTIYIGDHHELYVEKGDGIGRLKIEGPGSEHLTIDGEEKTRVFVVDAGGESEDRIVEITGLTVQRGWHEGAGIDADGGAALLQKEGNVFLDDVHFTDNHVVDNCSGGAIDFEGGVLTIDNSTIDYNSTETEFIEGNGGGIHEDATNGNLSLNNTIVRGNRAGGGSGGGIYQDEGELVIFDGQISENEASFDGGGVAATGEHGALTLFSAPEITGNVAGSDGGGIYADNEVGLEGDDPLFLKAVTIAGNEAEGRGGGVLADGPMAIEDSTISGNQIPTSEAGGGVAVTGGPVTIETTTIAENVGAGVYVDDGDTEIYDTTIAANTAAGDVAGGLVGEAPVKVRSSLLVDNIGKDDVEADCSGTEVTTEGHNAIGFTAAYCNWSEAEGDQLGVQADLGPLADNGGPTETMAPTKRGSAAINQGFQEGTEDRPTLTDQRERTRPVPSGSPTLVDVGAVEVQAPANTVPPSITPATELTAGEELTCEPGTWDTDTVTDPETDYAWRADGSVVAGGDTYELKAADAGKAIKCEVTVDNGATETTATTTGVELKPGELQLSTTTIEFSPRRVGSGPSPQQHFTVTNAGGTPVTISSVTGTESTQFPLETGACTGGDGVLDPGDGCAVDARFAPTAVGAQESTVTVHSDGGSPTVTLEGTGTAPALTIFPSSFDFGSRQVETGPSSPKSFEVVNSGTAATTLGAATVAGTDFALAPGGDECEGETLVPSASCVVKVVFEPTGGGARSGSLSFGGEAPASASLSGTGLAPVFSANPPSLDFGSRPIGSSAMAVVQVSNSGSAPMQVGPLALTGSDASAFALPPGGGACSGATLEPGQSCAVEVTFAPATAGAQSASLTVGGDAPGSVAVSGIGVQPQPQPTPPAPPTPSSATIAGKPNALHLGDTEGDVPLGITCDSPAGTSCQVSLELLGGRWSGRVAAGATRTVDFPLTKAGRKTLGERERMRAKIVLDVAGGEERSDSVLLAAPPESRLYVRSAHRGGDDLLLSLFCSGGASPRCGGRVSIEVPVPDVTLVAGDVTTRTRDDNARLPLTAAGRRFLDNFPRPSVIAKAVIVDVYQRTETVRAHFRLGE